VSRTRAVLAVVRQHWIAASLIAAGLVLRVLAQVAYQPALVYVDSLKYLYTIYPGSDPLGYEAPLKSILLVGNLAVVAAVQHLLGLAIAVTIYALLLRRGVPRWLSALAAAVFEALLVLLSRRTFDAALAALAPSAENH